MGKQCPKCNRTCGMYAAYCQCGHHFGWVNEKPKLFVIIFGSLATGIQTIHGPFTKELANQWAAMHSKNQQFVIHPLEE